MCGGLQPPLLKHKITYISLYIITQNNTDLWDLTQRHEVKQVGLAIEVNH